MALDRAALLLLLAVVYTYVLLAPFTKVEESFNVQAVHDLLYHGAATARYDHLQFPGVVPRTFLGEFFFGGVFLYSLHVMHAQLTSCTSSRTPCRRPRPTPAGALALAVAAAPARALGLPKLWVQAAARMALGTASVASLAALQRSVRGRLGPAAAAAFALLAALQFHLPFYMSRPLPNTLALVVTNLGLATWLAPHARPYRTVALLTAAATVFRCDAVLLAGLVGLHLLLTRQATLARGVAAGAAAAALGLAASVPLDSWLWRRWVWAEGEVLWFNTALNK